MVTKVPKPLHESVEVPTFKGKAIIGKDLVPTEIQGRFAPLVEVALHNFGVLTKLLFISIISSH